MPRILKEPAGVENAQCLGRLHNNAPLGRGSSGENLFAETEMTRRRWMDAALAVSLLVLPTASHADDPTDSLGGTGVTLYEIRERDLPNWEPLRHA
jgi:hypothetical protein